MADVVGNLTRGGVGVSLAISTASTVTSKRFDGPVYLTPIGTHCYARSGSSTASAVGIGSTSGSTSEDQFLLASVQYKFLAHGFIAAIASSGTGALHISPTG